MSRTLTVSNFDEVKYAKSSAGTYPEYEQRISPDGTTALLTAHVDDESAPEIEWYDQKWASQLTDEWES